MTRLAAAIDAAIDGLKPAETPDPDPGKVSKDELNAVIAQVKAKDLGGYTDESVRAVRDALAAAEKVAADPDATQAEIDAALASLNAVVDGLKAKDDGDKPDRVMVASPARVTASLTTAASPIPASRARATRPSPIPARRAG